MFPALLAEGMGLSPMSAYFEGPQPQHFFAPQPGPGPVAEPMPSEQPATSLVAPSEASEFGGPCAKECLLLVPSLLLVAMPFAPTSVLAPSSKARSP